MREARYDERTAAGKVSETDAFCRVAPFSKCLRCSCYCVVCCICCSCVHGIPRATHSSELKHLHRVTTKVSVYLNVSEIVIAFEVRECTHM